MKAPPFVTSRESERNSERTSLPGADYLQTTVGGIQQRGCNRRACMVVCSGNDDKFNTLRKVQKINRKNTLQRNARRLPHRPAPHRRLQSSGTDAARALACSFFEKLMRARMRFRESDRSKPSRSRLRSRPIPSKEKSLALMPKGFSSSAPTWSRGQSVNATLLLWSTWSTYAYTYACKAVGVTPTWSSP